MAALFIGVDAGGTSTRCVVAGETGEIVGRGHAGGANAISVQGPSANLLAALRSALDGLDTGRVTAGVFGMAGVRAAWPAVERAWREAALPGKPRVVPDMLVAFASATAEPDGTVLIAGTGAVAARIRGWRVTRRADGHGWLLGDEGSGVWLGRRAVAAALAALDGRSAPTVLTGRVAEAVLGAPAPEEPELIDEIVSAVYSRVAEYGPAWLATLAPLADAAAREGDPVAVEIVREAARSLARTARVVDDGTGPLVLGGSLLTQPTELGRLVRAELDGGRHPVPAGDGAAGAAALALRAALPPDDPRAAEGHRRLIRQGSR